MLSTLVSMNIKPTAYIMSKDINLNNDLEKLGANNQEFIADPAQERLKLIALRNAASDKKKKLLEIEPVGYDQTYTKTILTKDIFEKEEEQDTGKKREGKDKKDGGSRMKNSENTKGGNRCKNI